MSRNFKIGDRVIGVKNVDGIYLTEGKVGTVRGVDCGDNIVVYFDEEISGWAFSGYGTDHGHKLFCGTDEIKLYEETEEADEVEYKVGDYVKVGESNPTIYKVVKVDGNDLTLVEPASYHHANASQCRLIGWAE